MNSVLWMLVPYERLLFRTAFDADEIRKKIANVTEAPRWSIYFFLDKDHKLFMGQVENSAFKIWRVLHYRNSFLPVLDGTIEGSTVRVHMRLHVAVFLVMIFWMLLPFVSLWVSPASPMLGVFAIGYLMCLGGFKFEARKAEKALAELLGTAATRG